MVGERSQPKQGKENTSNATVMVWGDKHLFVPRLDPIKRDCNHPVHFPALIAASVNPGIIFLGF